MAGVSPSQEPVSGPPILILRRSGHDMLLPTHLWEIRASDEHLTASHPDGVVLRFRWDTLEQVRFL